MYSEGSLPPHHLKIMQNRFTTLQEIFASSMERLSAVREQLPPEVRAKFEGDMAVALQSHESLIIEYANNK